MHTLNLTEHNKLIARLDRCDSMIKQFKGPAYIRMDLRAIYHNVYAEYTKLDQTLVECRRKSRFTSVYNSQAERLANLLTTIEKRITWASLL